jgi:predicted ATPase
VGSCGGGTRIALGQREEQIGQIRQDLAAVRETGSALWAPYFLALMADAYAQQGQVDAGLATLAEALTVAQALGGGGAVSPPGKLAPAADGDTAGGGGDLVAAGPGCGPPPGGKIAGVAGRYDSESALAPAGKRQEAHDLLAEVYAWFTEGFDTADLQEAKALLEELA